MSEAYATADSTQVAVARRPLHLDTQVYARPRAIVVPI